MTALIYNVAMAAGLVILFTGICLEFSVGLACIVSGFVIIVSTFMTVFMSRFLRG